MSKEHNDSFGFLGRNDRWDIPLENDLMFSTVMQCRDACIGLLETIFDGRKVKSLEYKDPPSSVTQKYVVFNPANKIIRLDVYFEDGDSVYDIEIQKVDKGNLPRRTRMYSSMMDANMLDKGLDYNALKKGYVIFICLFDPFRRNRKTYFFENLCRDEPDLPLGDGRYTIFVNTKGSVGDSSRAMDAFFRYLNGGVSSIGTGEDSDDEFVRKLDRYVLDINGDEEWRQGYMKYELNLIESYRDGKAEGLSIGEARGEAKGISIGEANATNRMVKSMHSDGVPMVKISQYASIPVEEVEAILKS